MDVEERYNNLYKKLKQAIYYEPELYQQRLLAEYETEIKQNPDSKRSIYSILEYFQRDKSVPEIETAFIEESIDALIGKISYHIQPKKVSLNNQAENTPDKKKNKDDKDDERNVSKI